MRHLALLVAALVIAGCSPMYTSGGDGEPKSAMRLQCWGDSLTAGTGGVPYPEQLGELFDWTFANHGVGGETSTQIRSRMVADTGSHEHATIIWAGRNNSHAQTTVLADIAAMVDALPHRNFLVLSILNGDFPGEHLNAPVWTDITTLNQQLAATYGDRFVDVRTLLVARFDPTLAQDVIDHGNDVPPASLRSDPLHLNSTGYRIVAETIYAHRNPLVSPWPPRNGG